MSDIEPVASKPRLPPRWFIRFFWQAHRRLYRVSGGRFGLRRPKPGGSAARRPAETAVVVLEPQLGTSPR